MEPKRASTFKDILARSFSESHRSEVRSGNDELSAVSLQIKFVSLGCLGG